MIVLILQGAFMAANKKTRQVAEIIKSVQLCKPFRFGNIITEKLLSTEYDLSICEGYVVAKNKTCEYRIALSLCILEIEYV